MKIIEQVLEATKKQGMTLLRPGFEVVEETEVYDRLNLKKLKQVTSKATVFLQMSGPDGLEGNEYD
jgi:hypothetical protein